MIDATSLHKKFDGLFTLVVVAASSSAASRAVAENWNPGPRSFGDGVLRPR
jgi:hypothetical protein